MKHSSSKPKPLQDSLSATSKRMPPKRARSPEMTQSPQQEQDIEHLPPPQMLSKKPRTDGTAENEPPIITEEDLEIVQPNSNSISYTPSTENDMLTLLRDIRDTLEQGLQRIHVDLVNLLNTPVGGVPTVDLANTARPDYRVLNTKLKKLLSPEWTEHGKTIFHERRVSGEILQPKKIAVTAVAALAKRYENDEETFNREYEEFASRVEKELNIPYTRYKREDILNDSILIKAYYGLMRLISINRNIPKTGNVQKPEADSSQV